MKKLFFDFDNVYKSSIIPVDVIVITNLYEKESVINTKKEIIGREAMFADFISYCDKVKLKYDGDIVPLKITLFESFFLPLSIWINHINLLIENNSINLDTKIVFSSYASNKKIFVFEAEGESNSQFFYKKPYFLSYYLRQYLKDKGFKNISWMKDVSLGAKMSFYIRGPIVLTTKLLQIIFYKLIVTRRNFIRPSNSEKKCTSIFLLRGIVQSQFIEGIIKEMDQSTILITNEASSYPLRNFRFVKKHFSSEDFYFAEGKVDMLACFSWYLTAMSTYFRKREANNATFQDLTVNLNNFLPEFSVKEFHYKTYTSSIVNAINEIARDSILITKVVSFEMLAPFAFYIKKAISMPVWQIQTANILNSKYPSYAYGDRFYFNNEASYQKQCEVNDHSSEKFGVLHNLKYLGMKKRRKIDQIRTVTYFTQPIFIEEEEQIVQHLQRFCKTINAELLIKLHPRSNFKSYSHLNCITADVSSQDAVMATDLVVTRNSSVGEDCWFLNVPILFIVYGSLKASDVSYIPKIYMGKMNDEQEWNDLNLHIDNIIEDFYTHMFHERYYVDTKNLVSNLQS